MPIVFAFCRTAASVRFIAFATSTAGVLVFEWALSCRRSSLVHGLGTELFGMTFTPPSKRSMSLGCPTRFALQLHLPGVVGRQLLVCSSGIESGGKRACRPTQIRYPYSQALYRTRRKA